MRRQSPTTAQPSVGLILIDLAVCPVARENNANEHSKSHRFNRHWRRAWLGNRLHHLQALHDTAPCYYLCADRAGGPSTSHANADRRYLDQAGYCHADARPSYFHQGCSFRYRQGRGLVIALEWLTTIAVVIAGYIIWERSSAQLLAPAASRRRSSSR